MEQLRMLGEGVALAGMMAVVLLWAELAQAVVG